MVKRGGMAGLGGGRKAKCGRSGKILDKTRLRLENVRAWRSVGIYLFGRAWCAASRLAVAAFFRRSEASGPQENCLMNLLQRRTRGAVIANHCAVGAGFVIGAAMVLGFFARPTVSFAAAGYSGTVTDHLPASSRTASTSTRPRVRTRRRFRLTI